MLRSHSCWNSILGWRWWFTSSCSRGWREKFSDDGFCSCPYSLLVCFMLNHKLHQDHVVPILDIRSYDWFTEIQIARINSESIRENGIGLCHTINYHWLSYVKFQFKNVRFQILESLLRPRSGKLSRVGPDLMRSV